VHPISGKENKTSTARRKLTYYYEHQTRQRFYSGSRLGAVYFLPLSKPLSYKRLGFESYSHSLVWKGLGVRYVFDSTAKSYQPLSNHKIYLKEDGI
jgi:hypothetical protein